MSFDYNKWEEELRPKVEAHEFAFDASAWEQMEELLGENGGTMAPKDKIPPKSGRWYGWIFKGLSLSIIGVLCWWILRTNNENTVKLSSFNVAVTYTDIPSTNQTNPENAPNIVAAGSTTNPDFRQLLPANTIKTKKATPETSYPRPPLTNQEIAPEEEALVDRSSAYLTPPLMNDTAIPLLPSLLDEKLPTPILNRHKRKRDRRTLYPDVIERY